jgi:hypothetical protein
VVLNVGRSAAHHFRWENFCGPPSLIIGISWFISPSNQRILSNLIIRKLNSFVVKLSK